MRQIPLPTAIALATTLLIGTPALAGSASVSIDHLRFQVIDLDPTDGITASVSAIPYNIITSVAKGTNGHHSNFIGMAFDMDFGADAYNPVGAAGYTDSDVSGMFERQGGDVLSTGGWSGKTSAQTLASTVGTAVYSGIYFNLPFMLTPNTQLRVTADVPTLSFDETGNALSNARAYVQVQGDAISPQTAMAYAGHCYGNDICPDQTFPPSPNAYDVPGPLTLTVTNGTSQYQYGYAYIQLQSFTENLAAPVPEPANAALLLGGLAALGGWARRRAPR